MVFDLGNLIVSKVFLFLLVEYCSNWFVGKVGCIVGVVVKFKFINIDLVYFWVMFNILVKLGKFEGDNFVLVLIKLWVLELEIFFLCSE